MGESVSGSWSLGSIIKDIDTKTANRQLRRYQPRPYSISHSENKENTLEISLQVTVLR